MDSQINFSHMRCLTNLGVQVVVAAVAVLKSFSLNLGSAISQQVAKSCRLCPLPVHTSTNVRLWYEYWQCKRWKQTRSYHRDCKHSPNIILAASCLPHLVTFGAWQGALSLFVWWECCKHWSSKMETPACFWTWRWQGVEWIIWQCDTRRTLWACSTQTMSYMSLPLLEVPSRKTFEHNNYAVASAC